MIETLEQRAAPGEMAFASLGMFMMPKALASGVEVVAPQIDEDPPPDTFEQPRESAPPDDERELVVPAEQKPRGVTPPERVAPFSPSPDSELLESVFSDGGLESGLLGGAMTAAASPLLPPVEFGEMPRAVRPNTAGGGGSNIAARGNGGLNMRGNGVGAGDGSGAPEVGEVGVANYSENTFSGSGGGGSTSGGGSSSGGGSASGSGSGTGDPLVAVDDSHTITEDNSLTFSPLINDTGGEAAPFIIDVSQPGNGKAIYPATIDANGDPWPQVITYTPDEHYDGTETFSYTMTDGHGHTDTATVTINVTPVEDLPITDSKPAYTFEGWNALMIPKGQ